MAIEWVELKLVIADLDEQGIAARVAETERGDISISSLADLGNEKEQHRRLFELNRECARDIPDRGDFYSFEEYVRLRIEADSFDPRCVAIARVGGEWIGLTAASNHLDRGFMHDEMTGVVAAHRGHGLALSLKLANIRCMRSLGASVVHTMHHPKNTAAIEMNKKLGYVAR